MRALKVGSGLWSVVLTTNRVHKVRRTEAFRLPLVALSRRPNTERDEASLLFSFTFVNRGGEGGLSLTRPG